MMKIFRTGILNRYRPSSNGGWFLREIIAACLVFTERTQDRRNQKKANAFPRRPLNERDSLTFREFVSRILRIEILIGQPNVHLNVDVGVLFQ